MSDRTISNDHLQSAQRISFAEAWREGHRQALRDLRARWRSGGCWFLVVLWFMSLWLSLVSLAMSVSPSKEAACTPDGNFNVHPQRYQFWSKSGFFQITLGFGRLSFTQVKVIDIVWDIICGRGGQAVVAFVSWHVFANYVTTSMEVAPITFNTYRTMFLPNESLIFASYRLIQDFSRRRGLHSRIAMVFIIATMIFILAFPSFASSMTGYSGNIKSYIPDNNNNFISFSSFGMVRYIIHDGWRINKTGDFAFTIGSNVSDPVSLPNGADVHGYSWDACAMDIVLSNSETHDACLMYPEVISYVQSWGLNGLQQNTSSFLLSNNTIKLDPPVLNISVFFAESDYFGRDWAFSESEHKILARTSLGAWQYENNTYYWDYISSRGTCQTVEAYKWGFSFIQLNIMIMLCIVWTIGMVIMWTWTHFTLKGRGRVDVARDYKAVIELAAAIRKQVRRVPDLRATDLLTFPTARLRGHVRKDLQGGSICYRTPFFPTSDKSKKIAGSELKHWLGKEACWIVSILVTLGAGSIVFFLKSPVASLCIFGFSTALLLTVCIGSPGNSRVVLFVWFLFWWCVIPAVITFYLYL